MKKQEMDAIHKMRLQALEENGVTYACYYKRLKMGWSRKQAIETPMRKFSWKNRLKGKQNV